MKPLAGGALENAPLAIRFVMQNPYVSVVIPGMAEEKEIEQNIAAAADNSPLTEEERAEISRIRNTLGTEFCRRCNYCAPCTAGINISGSILFEGYFNRYDLKDWAYDRYMALPVRTDACVDCGVCESRCPYNLPIRKMLKRVQETFANYKK